MFDYQKQSYQHIMKEFSKVDVVFSSTTKMAFPKLTKLNQKIKIIYLSCVD